MAGTMSYLGLGANLGKPPAMLALALREVRGWPELSYFAVSSLVRGPYLGPGPAQPEYWNAVAQLFSPLSAQELLARTLRLQTSLDPEPRGRNAPRALDIDLLLHGDRRSTLPELTLPHPRMRSRRFVLEPLFELSPALQLPDDDTAVATLLASPTVQAQELCIVAKGEWWQGLEFACAS